MAEKKKTTASRRTGRSKPAARSTRSKAGDGPSRFFEGYGNEITGIILIGFGLLLTAGIFTDQTGRVGEFLKNMAIASLGSLGYIFPVLLLTLGMAFILRKRDFLLNRRTVGVTLVIFSILIMLSVGHMYRLDAMSLTSALTEIGDLREKTHGGVLGFLMTYPFIKLFGEVGAYIFSFLGMILGAVLIFNTTLYDSLKKGQEVTGQVTSKISDLREKNNELKEQAVQERDRTRMIGELSAPAGGKDPARSDKTRTFKHSPDQRAASASAGTSSAGRGKDEPEEKLTLPSFLADHPRMAHRSDPGRDSKSRFNIEVKGKSAGAPSPQAGKKAADPREKNPITVPYLESWNKVRDEKNPRPEEVRPQEPSKNLPPDDFTEENTLYQSEPDGTEPADEVGRVFVDPEDLDPFGASAAESEPMTEQEFQEYRKKKLAQTEKPASEKGRQIAMEEKLEKETEKPKPVYKYPGVALLKENMRGMMDEDDHHEILENARKLQDTLADFGVEARVIDVSKGPSVTRYELQLKAGIKVSKVTNLSDDIALGLAATGVRIEAPIPGKAAVGIEIPNRETVPVFLREVIDSDKFNKSTQKLAMGLGKDISGDIIIGDIAKFPHVLIAGATGSGKSVCINSLIVSLLYKYTPEEVRLIMVDPKMVELSVYNGIPHLLIPVVTDPKKAAGALNWAVNEMTRRYDLFNENTVRNIEGYNDLLAKGKIKEKLPYIVIIVDELADLMMVAAGEVESYIARLAQMARAAGMHLVIATQRPSVDVITGVIKANIPSRISFAVSSYVDSKTILDQGGAEKLLGKGDMLYSPMGAHKPKRVQGAFITEEEVEAIVSHIKVVESEVKYDESIIEHIEKGGSGANGQDEETDELLEEAVRIVMEYNQASTSFLQRRMRIGYNRAARIMDDLEQRGVISGPDGAKPRRVLWTSDDMI